MRNTYSYMLPSQIKNCGLSLAELQEELRFYGISPLVSELLCRLAEITSETNATCAGIMVQVSTERSSVLTRRQLRCIYCPFCGWEGCAS